MGDEEGQGSGDSVGGILGGCHPSEVQANPQEVDGRAVQADTRSLHGTSSNRIPARGVHKKIECIGRGADGDKTADAQMSGELGAHIRLTLYDMISTAMGPAQGHLHDEDTTCHPAI